MRNDHDLDICQSLVRMRWCLLQSIDTTTESDESYHFFVLSQLPISLSTSN